MEKYDMEKYENAKSCSPLAPWGVIAIAVVILLGNLGVISLYLTSILWPVLLGITGLLKFVDCGRKAKHCHCVARSDKVVVDRVDRVDRIDRRE